MAKQVIGINIAKKKIFACYQINDLDEYVVINGTTTSVTKSFSYSAKKGKHHSSPTIYVMETTGKYYEDLFYFFIITGC